SGHARHDHARDLLSRQAIRLVVLRLTFRQKCDHFIANLYAAIRTEADERTVLVTVEWLRHLERDDLAFRPIRRHRLAIHARERIHRDHDVVRLDAAELMRDHRLHGRTAQILDAHYASRFDDAAVPGHVTTERYDEQHVANFRTRLAVICDVHPLEW